MPYCTASDLYAFGVPRGTTPNPGRVLQSAASNVFTLDVHGFGEGDAVLFQPAGGGDLPAGLAAGTTYYASPLTEHTFRVRSSAGGSLVTFTDAEDPIMVLSPLPIAESIAWADRMIDDWIPAHAVPIDSAVPEIVRMTSAELAAGKLLAVMGAASQSLSDTADRAQKRLERWGKGVPLPGPSESNPARTNLAAVATAQAADTRGWRRFGGL